MTSSSCCACSGHYATHRRPPRLELINVGEFPGAARFIGLGQLPPEALRLIWTTRKPATPAVLKLGLEAWRALVNSDPRALASIMRSGTPALPLLPIALHRHLRELPSIVNGLSFTEEMALQLLAEKEFTLISLIGRQVFERDPLPGQGDLNVRNRVLGMEGATARVYERRPGIDLDGAARPPWDRRVDDDGSGPHGAGWRGGLPFFDPARAVGLAACRSGPGCLIGVGTSRQKTQCASRARSHKRNKVDLGTNRSRVT